ncbi:6-bladed beta-propeller [Candidatus Palauibacter sp.]|uniref:6-bladed beta-propeller n=1 Tax=Candidatus Palauibacter sp. TaxID=3101350 RepID=UPI003B529E5D
MIRLTISGMRRRLPSRVAVLLAVAVSIIAVRALTAQDMRDTLVPAFTLRMPDSMPLTYVEQLIPGREGSAFLIDARTEAILAFDPDGAFRAKIGARGEGPGELLAPWRLGLLGQDTLWVVDARLPRLNLYDVSTGASLADFGPSTWDVASAGGEPLRPFAVLADHRVVAVRWAERDVRLEVLAVHVMGQQTYPQGVSLASLDLRGRSLAVPVSTGDGSLQVRNPFSHSDMLAIDPSGRYVPVIRRPKPASARALFTVERNDVLESIVDTIRVPYTPRPVQRRDVRAWAENLGAVERMVELGAFPSQAAGVNAVLKALGTPDYHPPIRNRGRGIVEDGVLFDSEGKLWLQVSDVSGRINDWIVISSDGGVEVSRVSVPVRARLLAVQANRVWAEARDDYGVPMVQVFELRRSGR